MSFFLILKNFIYTAKDLEEWSENPESFHHEQKLVQGTKKKRYSQAGGWASINLWVLDLGATVDGASHEQADEQEYEWPDSYEQ
jgi:hypothetical protein